MSLRIHKYTGPLLLCTLFLLGLYIGIQSGKHLHSQKIARAAGERGGQWLWNFKGPLGDPGVLWIMHIVNQEYCKSDEISRFIARRFEEFTYHPILSLYKRLLETKGKESPLVENRLPEAAGVDRLVLPVLYCRELPITPALRKELLNYNVTTEYELTHIYLALLFLKDYGCDDNQIAEARRGIAEKIVQEQQQDSAFSDLFAERIGILYYDKAYRSIEPKWIEEIINAQQENGGWHDPKFGPSENPHTTALSIWALAEYSHSCPFPTN